MRFDERLLSRVSICLVDDTLPIHDNDGLYARWNVFGHGRRVYSDDGAGGDAVDGRRVYVGADDGATDGDAAAANGNAHARANGVANDGADGIAANDNVAAAVDTTSNAHANEHANERANTDAAMRTHRRRVDGRLGEWRRSCHRHAVLFERRGNWSASRQWPRRAVAIDGSACLRAARRATEFSSWCRDKCRYTHAD